MILIPRLMMMMGGWMVGCADDEGSCVGAESLGNLWQPYPPACGGCNTAVCNAVVGGCNAAVAAVRTAALRLI